MHSWFGFKSANCDKRKSSTILLQTHSHSSQISVAIKLEHTGVSVQVLTTVCHIRRMLRRLSCPSHSFAGTHLVITSASTAALGRPSNDFGFLSRFHTSDSLTSVLSTSFCLNGFSVFSQSSHPIQNGFFLQITFLRLFHFLSSIKPQFG